MRWNPEKKMRKKVTSKLMKTGCAAYVPALLHTEHAQPVNTRLRFIRDIEIDK
jgi:hypothetical protein